MTVLKKLRQKSNVEKVKIIWIISIIMVIIMLALWAVTTKIGKTGPKDTTLFQTISKGVKDIKDNYRKK